MSDDWVETTLGDVADFTNGYPFKPAQLQGSSLPVIRIKQLLDVTAETDFTDVEVPERNLISDGDLIFSWSGTLASRFWNRGPAALNQHLFRVSPKDDNDLGWIHYALDAAIEDLSQKTHGTTMKHVTKKVLESHSVVRPPLPVQRRIVDLMTHLDAHIANLQAERSASVALQAAARVTLTAPNEEWLQVTIGEVADFAGGYAFPERFQGQSEGTVPFFKVSDMNRRGSEKYLLIAANYVDHETLRLMKAKAWPKGTIVFPKVGAALKTEKRRLLTMESAFDNNCLGLVPREMVTSEFLFARMCAVRLSEFAQEGAVPSVNQAHVASIPIWLPSLSEQEVVGEVLNSIDHAVASIEVEIDRLNRVRKTILSGLMSREKQVDARYDALFAEAS